MDHRGLHVIMAQEFLDGSDVVTALQRVRGKGSPELVASSALRQFRLRDRFFHGFLNQGSVDVMAALFLHGL